MLMALMLTGLVTVQDMPKRETATWEAADGRMLTTEGSENFTQTPEGDWIRVRHTHPAGTTLSWPDLQMLGRLQEIIAATPETEYTASRGPKYADLMPAYKELLPRVHSDLAHERHLRMRHEPGEAERRINRELAKRNIITYDEMPVREAILRRLLAIKAQ